VWDADIRGGWWPEGRPKFPLVLGTDGAGVIIGKGKRTPHFMIGDRVWAYEFTNPKGGFYAEYVAVNARHVGTVPKRLDLLLAGAAAVTGLTALQGIDNHLRVRHGQSVLVFGASGAVGTLAVQFAKRKGARVVGTARGRAAQRLVRELGADAVIDPTKKNAADELRAFAPEGLHAAHALAGGDALEKFLEQMRTNARIAYPNGVEPEPKKRAKIRVIGYDAVAGRKEFARLNRAVDEARLQVPIAPAYSLAHAAQAHARIQRGHVLGRVVLRIRR
jgi:NADPH:quinone reductase-like Zn-dependent oxidoreductase